MSVVAVKVGKTYIDIASDSIIVHRWTQNKSTNKFAKLFQVNRMTIGSVGSCEESALLQVFCGTHQPEEPTESALTVFLAEFSKWKKERTDSYKIENDYIFVFKGKVFQVEAFFIDEILNSSAIGAGEDFALAALYFGKSVTEAVDVACELSAFCERPIKHFRVRR